MIRVENLSLGYGDKLILENLNFSVQTGEIVTILGSSGCGKSTLLKGLVGLLPPAGGRILIRTEEDILKDLSGMLIRKRKFGVLFQSGALLGSFTLGENIALPLREFGHLPEEAVEELVRFKLEQVRLREFADYMPADLSGGMRKRGGLARAMALDPEILFCDEPSAGLDPITGAEIDRLLMEFNRSLGITMVVVTHELGSIEAISHRSIMLDKEVRGIIAVGTPADLKSESKDRRVQAFFKRQPKERFV